MDIMHEFQRMLVCEIEKFSPDCSIDEELEDLLHKFLNLHEKLVDIHKREVYKSATLKKRKINLKYQIAIDLIEEKIIKGEDVNCHLSKLSRDTEYYDLLLSDWAIHHFHLSTTKKDPNDYLYDRSGKLLFARVSEKAVYFIDVLGHETNVFARKQLLQIIYNEWPYLLEHFELKGFLPGIPLMSNKEIKNMRETGANIIQQINDKLFVPMGGGITMEGTNMYDQMTSIRIKKWLVDIENLVKENQDEIIDEVKANTNTNIESLELKVMYIKHHFIFFEPNTKVILFDFPLPVCNL